MIQNSDLERVSEKLEQIEDEEAAVALLKKFNDQSTKVGKLILNLDPLIPSETWKAMCDEAQKELQAIIQEILEYK